MKWLLKGIASIYDILIVLALMVIIPAACLILFCNYYGSFSLKEMMEPNNYQSSEIFEDKGVSKNISVDFSEQEVEQILDGLHQAYEQDMLYKITEKVLDEKEYQNRYYSELTIVAAEKAGNEDDVYWYKYRKYYSKNDDSQVSEVVKYLYAKSNKVKKSDLAK